MILTAKENRRKEVTGLLFGIAFTSFLTGITEPIEFSFMFLSPVLYFVHAILTASSFIVVYLMDIHHGFGFSAGAIDYVLNFGIAQRPLFLLVIGLIYGVVYFAVFYFLIKGLNLSTPGREDEEDLEEEIDEGNDTVTGDKYDHLANQYIKALGGKENITSLDNCATRLRMQLDQPSQVDEKTLKRHGAKGVMKTGNKNVQVIVGTDVEFVASAMRERMNQSTHESVASNDKQETKEADSEKPSPKEPLQEKDFVAPITGTILDLTQVPDDVFSQKMMGDGFAIEPTDGSVVSPVDGEIVNVFPTKHAIGIRSNKGYEILIHVGVDTVELNGEGFETFVKEGDTVQKGQEIMKADIDQIKENVPSLISPIVLTNMADDAEITIKKDGQIEQGEADLITVQPN
ncbi:PTS system N-acetylglucosamine-specific transporter subunit EIICBA [Gracilibacillus halophilus YIM-C55.5]|uniref:PTS system N-acetylglucosamine-specific transporter subunit EIICBA n=1 Tax=Gracilibacillus halophilus YIM-C55.5 TaxID=1308866 RepID=N4WTN8_9BACI|nr:PTS system N-acetylglucosamine-specific transporter subunit EIICBA [Gracilibacillus halophilus YIM-C55.5]